VSGRCQASDLKVRSDRSTSVVPRYDTSVQRNTKTAGNRNGSCVGLAMMSRSRRHQRTCERGSNARELHETVTLYGTDVTQKTRRGTARRHVSSTVICHQLASRPTRIDLLTVRNLKCQLTPLATERNGSLNLHHVVSISVFCTLSEILRCIGRKAE